MSGASFDLENTETTKQTSASPLDRVANWLTATDSLSFGMWTTRILLLFSICLALSSIEFSAGPRSENPATIFSWLPAAILNSPILFTGVRVALIACTVLWAMRIWVPISCWATVVCFTLMWSLRMENLTNGAHIFNVTNMLLVIHAMWFQFYHRQINRTLGNGDLSQRLCYPRWVFLLCIFYLGWFHSLAGFTKIANSGLDWGDGRSLQLWVHLFGWEPSPFGQLILYDARLTAWLQTGALAIECASILAVFHRWFRYAIGFGLIGFYLGVLTTFINFGFHFNAVLVAWFLLPVDRLLGLNFSASENDDQC